MIIYLLSFFSEKLFLSSSGYFHLPLSAITWPPLVSYVNLGHSLSSSVLVYTTPHKLIKGCCEGRYNSYLEQHSRIFSSQYLLFHSTISCENPSKHFSNHSGYLSWLLAFWKVSILFWGMVTILSDFFKICNYIIIGSTGGVLFLCIPLAMNIFLCMTIFRMICQNFLWGDAT